MEEVPKVSPSQMQGADLLSQVHKSRLPSAPPGFYKSLSLDFVIVVLSVFAGVAFQKFLAGQIDFIWLLVVAGVFAGVSVLGSVLTKKLGRRTLVIIFESLGFILPFLGMPIDLLAISFAVMFILLFWGEYLSHEDADNSVEVRFFRLAKRPLSKMLSALTLVAVILSIPAWGQSKSFMSKASFDSIFGLTTGVVSGLYPEYKFGSNLDAFAKSIAEGQLNKDSQFVLLPAAIKNRVLDDASVKILDALSNASGIQLNPDETFASVAYDYLNKTLNDLKQKFGTNFTILWALAVFLLVRSTATLLGYLISLIAFVAYHALISFKVIRVATENKPREIIEFF